MHTSMGKVLKNEEILCYRICTEIEGKCWKMKIPCIFIYGNGMKVLQKEFKRFLPSMFMSNKVLYISTIAEFPVFVWYFPTYTISFMAEISCPA